MLAIGKPGSRPRLIWGDNLIQAEEQRQEDEVILPINELGDFWIRASDETIEPYVWSYDLIATDDSKAASCAVIDFQAEQIRAGIITPGSGQAMTYLRKEAEARAWLADNTATAPFVEAEATVTGRTIAEVAQIIVSQADAWLIIGPRIEATRIAAKRAVSQASTVAEMRAAAAIDWKAALSGQGN